MKKLLFPALILATTLGAAHLAHTQTASDAMALSEYRTALDQIAGGNAPGARVLLEQSLERGEITPESAVLLAYLEEKAGQNERARQVLQDVTTPTTFTSAYLSRLDGGALPVEVAGRAGARVASNPAIVENGDARIDKLEKLMFEAVNQERTSRGLAALKNDARMAGVARAHSAEMRDKNYFAHQSPTRGLRDPLDRYVAGIGQTPRLVAENIYRAWGSRSFLTEKDLLAGHKALMESPGHRSNILLVGAIKIGIGISTNASGDLWITQLYARP